jgi:broad specificity phosphatase PhoE
MTRLSSCLLVVIIEIRRHAQRATEGDASAVLSAAGLAMARALGVAAPTYAIVVSSPRPRARETALAIAGRVDGIDNVLDVASDEVLTEAQYSSAHSHELLTAHLRDNPLAYAFAQDQLSTWDRFAADLSDGKTALLVTHGGNIALGAVLLAERIGGTLDPLPLGHCEGVRLRYSNGRPLSVERLLTT